MDIVVNQVVNAEEQQLVRAICNHPLKLYKALKGMVKDSREAKIRREAELSSRQVRG
jgi:hypothetical protein